MLTRLRRLVERIGRRGAALILMGIVQISLGLSFVAPSTPKDRFDYLPLASHIPIQLWGALWVASGLATAVASLWRTGKDGWGFQAGYALWLLWGIDVLLSTMMGMYPLGWVRGIFGCLIYFGYMTLVLIISGMDGTSTIRRALEDGDRRGDS